MTWVSLVVVICIATQFRIARLLFSCYRAYIGSQWIGYLPDGYYNSGIGQTPGHEASLF